MLKHQPTTLCLLLTGYAIGGGEVVTPIPSDTSNKTE